MRGGIVLTLLAAVVVAGCAHTRTPASLVQARTLYDSLQGVGAGERAEAEMLRARDAIAQADSAVSEERPQDYADAMAQIALRTAQTAGAHYAALQVRQAVDSLRTARLQRLLQLTQAQRDELAARNQLSREEIAALRERNLIVSEREDSLSRQLDSLQVRTATGEVQAEALRQEAAMEQARSDSLRRVAEEATQQIDSLRRMAEEASRQQTAAEQQQSDSLRRVAEMATRLADSLRALSEAPAVQQDSARVGQDTAAQVQAQDTATGQPDPTGIAQEAAPQAEPAESQQTDSLRRVAQLATEEADSLRNAAAQESREQTEAERQRADSLSRVAEQANRQLDSLRTVAEASTREADSLRTAAEEASRATDSLRAEVAAANQRLNASLSELRNTVSELREVRATERGLVLGLSGVLFDVGKADLKPGAERNLRRIAEVLRQYPDYKLAVEGHTDSTGSAELNQRLSEARAEAVRQALVAGGLDESRITAEGFGESQPVATNATRAGRQQNRRVEVIVLGAGTDADKQ